MKIEILCAGKLKEAFYRDAAAEYLKRLSRYCKCFVTEVQDGPGPEKEMERFLSKLDPDSYLIALEIGGKSLSSEDFAQRIEDMGLSGQSKLTFLIGGSDGLEPALSQKADYHLSFSRMTFPHQLMRVILLEQIYRAFRIINGEPYHK